MKEEPSESGPEEAPREMGEGRRTVKETGAGAVMAKQKAQVSSRTLADFDLLPDPAHPFCGLQRVQSIPTLASYENTRG